MQTSSVSIIIGSIFLLILAVLNAITVDIVTPSFQRAEVLAATGSIVLLLLGILWLDVVPNKSTKVQLMGENGLFIKENIDDSSKNELAWGSHLILTATPASTILVYWEGKIILRRGIITSNKFIPGDICKRSSKTGKIISLVNTSMYPGSAEFDPIVKGLPSIIIYPLNSSGWVIVGGWSKRCFSKSDEQWIIGWSEKLKEHLIEKQT